jgi:hypothetical protein
MKKRQYAYMKDGMKKGKVVWMNERRYDEMKGSMNK